MNGEIIRWARKFYNMSPEEAAQAIGVDISRYMNWENGTEHPTYARLKKISDVFRKPSAVFFSLSHRNFLQLRATYVRFLMKSLIRSVKISLYSFKKQEDTNSA